jgi:hypothetical protein
MLAHRFDEQGHKIVYPAFAQPKFDGHRCIAVVKDGKATLWSRTRKPITGLPHIIKAWSLGLDLAVTSSWTGSCTTTTTRDRFEELTSFIRTPSPRWGTRRPVPHLRRGGAGESTGHPADRHSSSPAFKSGNEPWWPVETIEVENEDELMLAFERFLKEGYEG